jgi:hypothetical protein
VTVGASVDGGSHYLLLVVLPLGVVGPSGVLLVRFFAFLTLTEVAVLGLVVGFLLALAEVTFAFLVRSFLGLFLAFAEASFVGHVFSLLPGPCPIVFLPRDSLQAATEWSE